MRFGLNLEEHVFLYSSLPAVYVLFEPVRTHLVIFLIRITVPSKNSVESSHLPVKSNQTILHADVCPIGFIIVNSRFIPEL
mgnify:FL=1